MHRQKYFFFSCSTHFQGNHHIAGNSARRPHNSEPDPPKILIVSDWTTTPTTRAGSRQSRPFWPGNGRIASIPVVLAGEQLDPFHPGRSVLERPGSRTAGIQLFWLENEIASETRSSDGKRIWPILL
jgi:hypothetical protein